MDLNRIVTITWLVSSRCVFFDYVKPRPIGFATFIGFHTCQAGIASRKQSTKRIEILNKMAGWVVYISMMFKEFVFSHVGAFILAVC